MMSAGYTVMLVSLRMATHTHRMIAADKTTEPLLREGNNYVDVLKSHLRKDSRQTTHRMPEKHAKEGDGEMSKGQWRQNTM